MVVRNASGIKETSQNEGDSKEGAYKEEDKMRLEKSTIE
jgi:hypothetical protein